MKHLISKFSRFYPIVHLPLNYYTCSNRDPDLDGPISKSNFSYLAIISIVMHLFVKLKISWFQRKKQAKEELNPKICISQQGLTSSQIEVQSIPDFTTSVIGICIFISYAMLAERMNSKTVCELNTSPNYIVMNFFQLICPCVMTCIICALYYYRHPFIGSTLLRELENNFFPGIQNKISFSFDCHK